MKNTNKTLALLLSAAMVATALAGCGGGTSSSSSTADSGSSSSTQEGTEKVNDTLVVGYAPFSSKFSPFFAETGYDQDASDFTQLGVFGVDRVGSPVLNGIEGETRSYNGTDYTYYGASDVTVTENDDGTVDYDIKLREDLVFSDGEPVTIDDVIFSLYVLCDPTYDGASTVYAAPIVGLEEYRSGMDTRGKAIYAAGEDNANFDLWTEEQQTAFWDYYNNNALSDFGQAIVDYCVSNYLAAYAEAATGFTAEEISGDEGLQVVFGMAMWNFGSVGEDGKFVTAAGAEFDLAGGERPAITDYADALAATYGDDIAGMEEAEAPSGQTLVNLTIAALGDEYAAGVEVGDSAANIAGIVKTGDYSLRVTTSSYDATTIYHLSLAIAPMHYYGDASKYDYENNKFGFDKGDLSTVRAKISQPMGAGPYKFIKYENGVITYEANENYYLGEPKIKYLNLKEVQEADKLNGVVTGAIDITDPSFSKDAANAISDANGGELNGDVITVDTVDNLGYGYIGIAAENVNVGGVTDSEESKNLRKALATILSVYRDVAIDSYYGDAAEVINYPISSTSWAAPQTTDDGYQVAFSVDVDGNPIYTSDMSAEDKYAAAKQAALGFLEAAGYTIEDGKAVAAPEGASLEYELQIPADGAGDHPSFMICTLAKEALAEIGITLIVNDLANSSDLWTNLDACTVDMWAAAWGATVDPDMYQIYHSTNITGPNAPSGSTGSNNYHITDATLDELIMDARVSPDQTYRKAMYKECLDIILDWAVEVPIYQRQNCVIFSTERVNMDTVTPDITTFYGWMAEIENMELN